MESYSPSLLFHLVHDLISLQSISCNALLWYLILRHTPPHLKSYSIMLLFSSTYELLSAASGFFIFPRIISLGNEALLLVIYGPCAYFEKSPICYAAYGLELNALACYNIQMTASFAFRYYVLRHPTPSVRLTVRFNIILAIPTIVCFILFNLGRTPVDEAMKIVMPLIPTYASHYNLTGTRMEATIDPLRNPAIGITLWLCSTAMPCFWINIFSGLSIHRFLSNKAYHLSERTRSLHWQLLRALISQCLISQLFVIAVTSFLLGHFDIIKHPVLEYAVHFMGDICICLSPLTTLCFVSAYRTKALGMLGICQESEKLSTGLSAKDMTTTTNSRPIIVVFP